MRTAYLLAVGVPLALACGGAGTPAPTVPEGPEIVPVPRMPKPPEISARPKAGQEVDEAIVRRLRAANPMIRRCLEERRAEIPRARDAVAISVDLHVTRDATSTGVDVVRDGFRNLELVEACILDPLLNVDAEGLTFDLQWYIVADFP
ncbi:MAG: hypothetical protein KC656_26835 [Myxococcales bacterium]|nr:hypothetical protein [Myxococcales bacterium]